MEKVDLSEITREDIIKAMIKYDDMKANNKLYSFKESKNTLLLYRGREYYPKHLMKIIDLKEVNVQRIEKIIIRNGFELYKYGEFKEYLSDHKKFLKSTINTYVTDLKKGIKIIQLMKDYEEKQNFEILDAIIKDKISQEIFNEILINNGYIDFNLITSLKTKAKEYQNFLLIKNKLNLTEEELKTMILEFRNRWIETNELKVRDLYPNNKKSYKGYKINMSYGKGKRLLPPKMPWIGFLKYEQAMSEGIYPIIIINKDTSYSILIGFSYENPPHLKEKIIDYFKKNTFEYKTLEIDEVLERLNYIMGKFEEKMEEQTMTIKKSKAQSLNQILYGPPGTGKTYHTINKAIEILEKGFYEEHKEDTKENRKALKNKFEELKENKQIEFITFHQSYGYEEFVEGIKAETNERDEITYNVEDGIFKRISKKAKRNYFKSIKDIIVKEEFEDIFREKIIENFTEEKFKILTPRGYFFITEITETTIRFDKASGESKHTLSIATLKKMYDKKENFIKGGLHGYYQGILNILCKRSNLKSIKVEPLKNYILIIDEINRGNISKIFGELITLIEDSKRIGKDEELQITLPYSGEKFGVPKNLYILGTMNTADRSIALMDTALRRRFEFTEMMPKYDLLKNKIIDGINLGNMLEKINKRIEYLYDRDHTIGHAYFIGINTKEELDSVMRNKIIPLLQEYFYDDWEKIQIVLGDHKKQLKTYKEELNNENYRFIKSKKIEEIDVLGFNHDEIEDENITYKINSNFSKESYIKIYDGKK